MRHHLLKPLLPLLLTPVLTLSQGCAEQGRPVVAGTSNAAKSKPKPARVELSPLVVTQLSADEIGAIHARGMSQLKNGAVLAAERDFALCYRAAPSGPYAASSLFHGGLALDELGRFDAALQNFAGVAEGFGETEYALSATLRAVRLACHLENWELARGLSQRALERRAELRSPDLILLHGAVALDAIARRDEATAELSVARARNEIEQGGFDAPGRIHRDVAAVYFALGELRRLRAEQIALSPPPRNFAEILEQRCELILGAQSAYSEAMRAYDAHWSTMAGFRTGELYSGLHEELMRIRPPETAKDQAQRQLFEGAIRVRYSVLVEKALAMITHTLAMAERTGEHSEWVTRAKTSERELRQRLSDEQRAIDAIPYTRQALEDGLHALEQGAQRASR